MKNNNVEKMLEGKGDLSEAKEIMKLASDYKDPADAEIDLSIDLLESFKKQYREMVKEGYKSSYFTVNMEKKVLSLQQLNVLKIKLQMSHN